MSASLPLIPQERRYSGHRSVSQKCQQRPSDRHQPDRSIRPTAVIGGLLDAFLAAFPRHENPLTNLGPCAIGPGRLELEGLPGLRHQSAQQVLARQAAYRVLVLVVAPLPLWAPWQSAEALAAVKEIRPFSALRAYDSATPPCRVERRTSGRQRMAINARRWRVRALHPAVGLVPRKWRQAPDA
jgi:hypothetical protein